MGFRPADGEHDSMGSLAALRPAPYGPCFGRLLRSEWLKLVSVRSTPWSLAILVAASTGLNAVVAVTTVPSWVHHPADRAAYLADPTRFLAAALGFAQIPVAVLGAMVIASEYSTGMIRSSVLAVPRRTPMLAAKAAVFAAAALVAGEVIGFSSFAIAKVVLGRQVPMSLANPDILRAVIGVGPYLAVLGLIGLAIGGLVRHTGAAVTVVALVLVVLSGAAQSVFTTGTGKDIAACLPANAGVLITHAHKEAVDVLAPWQGFAVAIVWCAVLLGAAALVLRRRDV
jgi:ABC-type transport system involved in multi-copper enzyme maturation permease subunit